MCKLCMFVSNSKQKALYWTRISHEHYKRGTRECNPMIRAKTSEQCKRECFASNSDKSHQNGPKDLCQCKSHENNRNFTFCLLHCSRTESLPTQLDIRSVAQEYSQKNITKKRFSLNRALRKSLNSIQNARFGLRGGGGRGVCAGGEQGRSDDPPAQA